jgi:hypothetical protein
MCQEKIVNYLRTKRDYVDIHDLIIHCPMMNRVTISAACRKMAKRREILIRKVKVGSFIKYLFKLNLKSPYL